jgi:hypothetical protein
MQMRAPVHHLFHPLERDDFSSNRHPALSHLFEHDLRANALGVCREGKPLPTFPDHALNPRATEVDPRILCSARQ